VEDIRAALIETIGAAERLGEILIAAHLAAALDCDDERLRETDAQPAYT
jgi:hypothetical protein